MKTIILGVGNQILGDDGVGIHVVNELKKQLNNPNITIDEAITGGMNLLELLLGYDKAIIVDAVKTEDGENGEVKRIPLGDFSTKHSCNPHDVSLIEAIEMAKKMGEDRTPREIIVIGVMMKEIPCEFGEKLSNKIAAAVPKAVDMTLNEIKKDLKI
jgi:hydrogenase maturation protease